MERMLRSRSQPTFTLTSLGVGWLALSLDLCQNLANLTCLDKIHAR